MDNKNPYFRQVELLVRILPLVGEHPCFSLKGGTAINLFYRNMPRLSVDIDLVYVPIGEWIPSLDSMTRNLKGIGDTVIARIPGAKITYSSLNHTDYINRLFIEAGRAVVKVELSPVLRGTVFEPTVMRITKTAEEIFGFAEIPVVSFEDLFAGKIMAALDRQHPRDLYDIKGLLEGEGISARMKEAFIVYLLSHNRRIVEIFNPNLLDIKQTYETDFVGMTTCKGRPFLISLVELLEAVPGTLFLKTLDSDRHLAIPVDFLESVPGTDGYSGAFPSEQRPKQQIDHWAHSTQKADHF